MSKHDTTDWQLNTVREICGICFIQVLPAGFFGFVLFFYFLFFNALGLQRKELRSNLSRFCPWIGSGKSWHLHPGLVDRPSEFSQHGYTSFSLQAELLQYVKWSVSLHPPAMCRFFSHGLYVLSSVCTSNYLRPTFAQKKKKKHLTYITYICAAITFLSFLLHNWFACVYVGGWDKEYVKVRVYRSSLMY